MMKNFSALLTVGVFTLMLTGCSNYGGTPRVDVYGAWITTPVGDVNCLINGLNPEDGNRAVKNSDSDFIDLTGSTDCDWSTLTEKGSETADTYHDFQGKILEGANGRETFCIINYSHMRPATTDCNWE